jgi:hypothetical protein
MIWSPTAMALRPTPTAFLFTAHMTSLLGWLCLLTAAFFSGHSHSWHLQRPGVSTAAYTSSSLYAYCYQGLPIGTSTVPHMACLPRVSFEIWVEAWQLLHSVCLQNKYHVEDSIEICCQPEQYPGHLGPPLQWPLSAWVIESRKTLP